MTLETTPQYDEDRVSRCGDHAVVIGGSMAGLLTARVLADAFETVTVVERDELPQEPVVRRGVPQGRHVHALQTAGRVTLEDLFPGYSDDLEAAGAEVIDVATEYSFYDEGEFVADGTEQLPMYCASRPLFETVTVERIADRENVRLRDRCHVTSVRLDEHNATVTGVTVRTDDGGTEDVAADLVVDATGRTSRTPEWLAEHGYPVPAEDEVAVDLTYGTVYLDRPAGDTRALQVMPNPPRKRGAIVLPVEDGRWVMTLFGLHGDHPPTDLGAFVDFAADLPVDEIARLVEERPVVSDGVSRYPFPSSLRRRYWELDRFPEGVVVVGDAVASFNPIYGQGISVAALEALHLHQALADGGRNDLAPRFFDRIEDVVEDAWNMAVGSDFQFAETTGPKPAGTALLNRYMSRLTRKAHGDGRLATAYARVAAMERKPASLLRPGIAWRVLRPAVGPWGRGERTESGSAPEQEGDTVMKGKA